MDEIDIKILNLLEEDGRISHEEMGRRLNLSRPAIHQRVNKLEKKDIITGYKAKIDWTSVGQVINAIVSVNVHTLNFTKVMNEIKDFKISDLNIEKVYRVTGEWCIILKVRCKKTDQLTALHDELLKIEGMDSTYTIIILSEI